MRVEVAVVMTCFKELGGGEERVAEVKVEEGREGARKAEEVLGEDKAAVVENDDEEVDDADLGDKQDEEGVKVGVNTLSATVEGRVGVAERRAIEEDNECVRECVCEGRGVEEVEAIERKAKVEVVVGVEGTEERGEEGREEREREERECKVEVVGVEGEEVIAGDEALVDKGRDSSILKKRTNKVRQTCQFKVGLWGVMHALVAIQFTSREVFNRVLYLVCIISVIFIQIYIKYMLHATDTYFFLSLSLCLSSVPSLFLLLFFLLDSYPPSIL